MTKKKNKLAHIFNIFDSSLEKKTKTDKNKKNLKILQTANFSYVKRKNKFAKVARSMPFDISSEAQLMFNVYPKAQTAIERSGMISIK